MDEETNLRESLNRNYYLCHKRLNCWKNKNQMIQFDLCFSTAECTDQRKLLIVIVLMLQQQASWILPVLLGIAPYQFVCQVWWAHVITSYYVYKVDHSIISGITLWLCYDTYGRLLVYWSSATPSYWNDSYIFDAIAWTN